MSKFTTLDVWTDICQSLFPRRAAETTVHPVHSCIINGERHYIHSPRLAEKDPSYFKRLVEYASKNCIRLKADRRILGDDSNHGRRKRLLPIIFLAFGVNAGNVFADNRETTLNTELQQSMAAPSLDVGRHYNSSIGNKKPINKETSKRLQSILASHFIGQEDDPRSIGEDMQMLADYYSTHPEASDLIESIAEEDWKLMYAPHTFQTDASSSSAQIEEVTIYFDPRSGAKLKFYDKCATKVPFCVASPADALLHELLYVHSILKEPSNLVSDDGASTHLYPAAHEHKTILKENILYMSMSRRDNHPRPIRSENTGRHVLISCVSGSDA